METRRMANSFLDLAIEVLKKAPKPLTYQEVWELGKQLGFATKIKTTGKTPWQSLGAQLYVCLLYTSDAADE